MHLGHIRALHIDTIDRGAGAPKRYRFRASTAGKARGDKYLLSPGGWLLDNYRRYPVILAFHDYRSFPIGIATHLETDAEGLIDEVEFDDGDPLGADAMRKLDRGIPIAQSVGFDVLEIARTAVFEGFISSDTQELLEISMVGLPSDPGALPMRAFDIDDLTERILERLYTPKPQPTEAAPEPSLLDLLATVRLRLAAETRDLSEAERLALSAIVRACPDIGTVRPPTPRVRHDLLARLEELTCG